MVLNNAPDYNGFLGGCEISGLCANSCPAWLQACPSRKREASGRTDMSGVGQDIAGAGGITAFPDQ